MQIDGKKIFKNKSQKLAKLTLKVISKKINLYIK